MSSVVLVKSFLGQLEKFWFLSSSFFLKIAAKRMGIALEDSSKKERKRGKNPINL